MNDRRNQPAACRLALAACFSFVLAAAPEHLAAQTTSPETPSNQTPSEQTLHRSSIAAPAVTPILTPTSMQAVVADAVQDFRRIPSWTNVGILVAGGIGAAIGHSSDAMVSRTLSGSPSLGSLFKAGETVGGARTQMAAALGTYAIGRFSGQNRVAAIGADLIQSQILAQTMTAAIKMSVGRTRPDGTQYSFPSGHASVTFATATVLQRDLGWKVGVPAYGLATYVAASRIQDKRHFLSDVAFGAAIGIVAGRSVTVGRGDARFAVAPAAAPGGGGISLTWRPKG
jgi:membrane-associated phospholipid phosphatase